MILAKINGPQLIEKRKEMIMAAASVIEAKINNLKKENS
jgi:hypothetical protein